ncbi:MAG: aminopeptidase, partial [Ignavibacteria bacterium]
MKIQIKLLTALVLISIYSFSFPPLDEKDEIEKLRNKQITKEEIFQHIKYLSSDQLEGRFPGTKGDQLTSNYISDEFKKYKLTPYGDDGYLQPFDIYTQVELSGKNEFETIADGNRNSYSVEKDFIPLGFSSKGRIEGDLVFLGYGISAPEQNYDDYKDINGNDIDVRGKILVVMKYSPGGTEPHNNPFQKYEPARFKTLNARDGNAAGIIIINGPNSGEDNLSRLLYDNV